MQCGVQAHSSYSLCIVGRQGGRPQPHLQAVSRASWFPPQSPHLETSIQALRSAIVRASPDTGEADKAQLAPAVSCPFLT